MTANTVQTTNSQGKSLGDIVRQLGSSWRGGIAIALLIMGGWELLARSGQFNPLFVPTTGATATALIEMGQSGVLWEHLWRSVTRLFAGFAVASAIGVTVGLLMGRSRTISEFFSPLVNLLLPIPSLAWIPLFMLWFGLGDRAILPLVILAAFLPIVLNTWTGMRSVPETWLRAAQAMNVDGLRLFFRVLVPGSLSLILTGLRVGMAQAWRAVIAGELIAAAESGLGVAIFNAKLFINTPRMLAMLVVIGVFSQIFEKLVFGQLERVTLERWGMSN